MIRFRRQIEDFTVVTLLALLIWFYAESRTSKVTGPRVLTLKLHVASEELLITQPNPRQVSVEFRGSQSALSQLNSRLSAGALDITIPDPQPGENQRIPLANLIPLAMQLEDTSVNIHSITPEVVEISVARLVTVDAKLVFNPSDVSLQDGYEIDPATVKLKIDESLLEELYPDGQVQLHVQLQGRDMHSLPANERLQDVRANVVLPEALRGNPRASITPDVAKLSFTIEKRDTTYTVKRPISVKLRLPSDQLEAPKFNIVMNKEDQLITGLVVSGSPDAIARLENEETLIVADVDLWRDQLVSAADKGEQKYPVRIPLDGLDLRIEHNPKPEVRITITRND